MSIINFKSYLDWEDYLQEKKIKTNKINHGSEGVCYLPYQDDIAYKIMNKDSATTHLKKYIVKDIITTSNIMLPSFAFPQQLFTVKDNLVGYTAKYIPNDIFYLSIKQDTQILKTIDYEMLIKSLKVLKKDVILLSKEKIKLYDLLPNLLYNGKFYAIDTIGYYYDKEETKSLVLRKNLFNLNHSLNSIFDIWTLKDKENNAELTKYLSYDSEIYLKEVAKLYSKKN